MTATTFLRFPDEATFVSSCETAGYWITEEPERPLLLSHKHTFDVVGTITEGGEWDPDTGEVIIPPVVLDGWHVNAKLPELPAGWDTYVVTPASPVRIFAGD